MFSDDEGKARKRLGGGVHAVIGANGDGKSLLAAHDVRYLLEEGVAVLSSCRLLDYDNPRACDDDACTFPGHAEGHGAPHPLWVPLTTFEQLLDWRDGAVFLDEVTGWADARDHSGMPAQARTFLRKLRHYDIPLIWTAPDWMAADAILRRVTRVVTVSKGMLGVEHVKDCRGCERQHKKPDETCELHSAVRLWPDNRFFRWETFDAVAFESWSMAKTDVSVKGGKRKRKPMVKQLYRRGPNVAQHVYSTYAEVLGVATANDAGVCVVCAGTRKRAECACPEYQDRKQSARRSPAAPATTPISPPGASSLPRRRAARQGSAAGRVAPLTGSATVGLSEVTGGDDGQARRKSSKARVVANETTRPVVSFAP